MKKKELFTKIILIAIVIAVLLSLILPAIFAQTPVAQPKQEKLLNGLKVLMWSDDKADKVSVRLRIHSGAAFDPQGKEGVMRLLADNIFPDHSTRDFFRDELDGDLKVIVDHDLIEVDASVKPESLLTMLETISSAVANPDIDKETTAKLRVALMARVAELEKDPSYVADGAVAERLLGTFPYGRPENGSSSSVSNIGFADLIDAKERFLTADNATIAVIGKFDRSLAYKAIRRYFGNWLKSDKKIPSTFRQPDLPPSDTLILESDGTDASLIRTAIRGTARNGKDFGASLVFVAIVEDRLRKSFADGTFVKVIPHSLPGMIIAGSDISGSVDPPKTLFSAAVLAPVTDAEFQAGKSLAKSRWAKKDAYEFWLDADTFRTSSPDADMKLVDKVSLADVNAFAERARGLPAASVILTPTLKPSN